MYKDNPPRNYVQNIELNLFGLLIMDYIYYNLICIFHREFFT